MATKQLSNDFMQQIANEEAWKELSGDFPWTESLLEKSQDIVDWEEVSENQRTQWTIPMVQKFKNRIDWKRFSRNADEKFLTEDSLEAFKNKWDWNELSKSMCLDLTEELLEKFIDKWDWEAVIVNTHVTLFIRNPIGFYEKYKEHIPESVLHGSELWRTIIWTCKYELQEKIIA